MGRDRRFFFSSNDLTFLFCLAHWPLLKFIFLWTLKLWNYRPSERFLCYPRSHLLMAFGVLAIFDVSSRATFNAIKDFVSTIRDSTRLDSVIVLVGNKIDLPNRAVSTEEASTFARSQGLLYTETSAKTGEGIQELFEMLVRDVAAKVESGALSIPPIDPTIIKLTDEPSSSGSCERKTPVCSCIPIPMWYECRIFVF